MRLKFILFSIIGSLLFASCNKDENITLAMDANLSFSTDTILFDTVFTSVGSTNRRLKIINPNEMAINLNNIKLSGGNSSAYSLNINGQAITETSNLKINGNDSINLFVKVNIKPTIQRLPFLVQDSILFYFNGKKQSIPLISYGQNANFINEKTITSNTIWSSKLPYIINNSLTVAENVNLSIEPGTKVLFHGNGTLSIKGTLTAVGTSSENIIFSSDRLEKIYENETGQWNGLHFYPESKDSQMHFTIVKNGVAGITVDGLSITNKPKLLLTNSIVKNMEVVGFLGYETELTAFNNLFYNCGQYLLYGVGGGNYNLKQNTFAGYNINFIRKTAAVYLSDFISNTQFNNLKVDFFNNIVFGKLADEFIIDKKIAKSTVTSTVKNNLLKTSSNLYNSNGNLINVEPQFADEDSYDFRLGKSSTLTKKGISLNADMYFDSYLNKDLKSKPRIFPSSLGCYEY